MFNPGLIDMIMRLRGRGISDNAVLRAMELVDRRHFVDQKYWEVAYDERSLPISCGQTLSPPFTVALLTQMLELKPDMKVLEIGTGSGYHVAVLSNIVKRVYSVERYKTLIAEAEQCLAKLKISNHVIRHGDGNYGWKGQAPFDRILLTCAIEKEPSRLLSQLADKSVLLAVIDGEVVRFRKVGKKTKTETLLKLTLPSIEAGKSKSL